MVLVHPMEKLVGGPFDFAGKGIVRWATTEQLAFSTASNLHTRLEVFRAIKRVSRRFMTR